MDNGLSLRRGGGERLRQGVLILIVMDNGLSRLLLACRGQGRQEVLILIVMDNGLSRDRYAGTVNVLTVLILIVMDNGLSHRLHRGQRGREGRLNPYCNG